MKIELILDLVGHIEGNSKSDLKVGKCSKNISEQIERWDIPLNLKRLLQLAWFNHPYESTPYLSSVKEIVEEDDRERFMAQGMLQIGNCLNGDMIAVDFSQGECPVLFVSHDELWENQNSTPRSSAVVIFDSLAELLLRLAEGLYVPMDWFAGKEYRQLVEEMRHRTIAP